MISFRGQKVCSVNAKEFYPMIALVSDHPASLIEMNPFCHCDVLTYNKLRHWGLNAALISDIFQYERNNENSRYFLLTTQNDDFDQISQPSILSIAKTTSMADDEVMIDMIQVNPWYISRRDWKDSKLPFKTFVECGKVTIQAFKNTFVNKDLWLHAPKNLINYFKKLGFEIVKSPDDKGDALMKFSKNIK